MGLGSGLGVYLPIVVYLACIFGTIISAARPQVGIYLLALILPLAHARGRLFEYPFGSHAIEVLLLGVLIGVVARGENPLPQVRGRNILLTMAITSYISLWIGPILNSAVPWPLTMGESPFARWILYMRMPAIFVLTYLAINTKRKMEILLLCMLVSFLWVGKGFRTTMGARDVSQSFSNNLRSGAGLGFGGSNGMAAFQLGSAAFLIGIFGADKRWRIRIPILAAIAMGVYGILFSYSRGAYVGFALVLCYVSFFKMRWLVPVLLIVALNAQWILPQSVKDRISMTYQEKEGEEELESSAGDRLEIWMHALQTTLRDPILGVGFDTYRYYRQDQALRDAHNMYLRALVDTGVVGLVLLVMFWLTGLKAGHQLFRVANDPLFKGIGFGFAGHVIGLMAANMFGDRWTYIELCGPTVLLMGMVMRAHALIQQPEQAPRVMVPRPQRMASPMPQPAR